jgi:tetratricopeptide (TPR) repeat protein
MHGVALREQGRLDEAVREFEAALALAPLESTSALQQLISLYQEMGEPGRGAAAVQQMEAALAPALPLEELDRLRHDPRVDREVMNGWVLSLYRDGNDGQAVSMAEEYCRRWPSDPQGYYNRATILRRLTPDRPEPRIQLYRQAIFWGIRYESNAALCYTALAEDYRTMGQKALAQEARRQSELLAW